MVLRVQTIRALPCGRAASTREAVAVAIPDIRQSRFSATRSAVRMPRAGPESRITASPGANRAPSPRSIVTETAGSMSAKARAAASTPETVPGWRAAITASISAKLAKDADLSALRIDVENLRSPDSYYSYEEKAREDYGMIGKNETYFVLPDSEIASIPDIPGLAEKERRHNPTHSLLPHPPAPPANAQEIGSQLTLESMEDDGNNDDTAAPQPANKDVESIPVTPVPFQLESLQ